MNGVLCEIIDAHRRSASADARDLNELRRQALATAPARDFEAALRSPNISVIAEIKRRSPSLGALAPDVDAATLAATYETGGAACLSVLTDAHYFAGSVDDLQRARGAVDIPVIRKDFTVCEADVLDARIMGADAVLLIVAALSKSELRELFDVATTVGITPLVEVHDESELEDAIACNARVIGVNQRNLVDFEIDGGLAARLRGLMPTSAVAVAESGVRDARDVHILEDVGYDAALIGTALVTSQDPGGLVREMITR